MSTIKIIPYHHDHLDEIKEYEAFDYLKPFLSPEYSKDLEGKLSYTGVTEMGKIVFCAGIMEFWANRGEAWAILDKNCKPYFLQIHNAVRNFLHSCPIKRIEATVDVSFEAGHRWVRALGFELEAPRMTAYRVGGIDAALYSLVKKTSFGGLN